MNEIERAKVQAAYDECYKIYSCYSEHRETILDILRAELARQDAKPLTCDGCAFDVKDDGSMRYSRCGNCTRQERPWMTDRYEPKGEKA